MTQDEWYRNSGWDDQISAKFEQKLSDTRSQRAQYLKIQAEYLSRSHPKIALSLIDRYFETKDEFFVAQAHTIRGRALQTLGMKAKALEEYRHALNWESAHPHTITDAWSSFCKLVAENRVEAEYEFALSVLARETIDAGGPFPIGRYIWNGCQALIASDLGKTEAAKRFAEAALDAAGEKESPFTLQTNLGLVGSSPSRFRKRLEEIAG